MAKTKERMLARKLRIRGESIKEIAKKLKVSSGSVSIWCEDLVLSSTQKEYLFQRQVKAGHRGRMLGTEANKRKKLENVVLQEKNARKMIGKMTKRDKLLLGIGLYWGEGTKARTSGTALVNSDPSIILFARDWFEQLGVKRSEFNPYIYISETHQSRERTIEKFWSNLLEIPISQFNKVIFLKGRRKKIYANHDSYYGVLALRVARGTTLRYKIMGLVQACK